MSSSDGVTVQLSMPQVRMIAYWALLALGGLLLLIGFSNKEYGFLIASCFFGIVARIVQAEHHFLERAKRPGADHGG